MTEDQKILINQVQGLLEYSDIESLSKLLKEQRSSDISEVTEMLETEQILLLFQALDTETAADVLERMGEATRSEVVETMAPDKLAHLLEYLSSSDAADILMEMSDDEREKVLALMPESEVHEIRDLMSYSEDSAGGIMDPVLIRVRENSTVAQAIQKIRAQEIDEDFYSVFVVDKFGRYLGDVRIRMLLTAPEDTLMIDLLEEDNIYVYANADQEEVRNIFSREALITLPVLNRNNKLVGRITADRVIEVAEEEAAEDMLVMAGTNANELENFSIIHAARVRMTWLLPCMAGTGVTALVLMLFKDKFAFENLALVYLTAVAFVPMIAAISGNAGLQTSAIVVSGLATGHLAALHIRQVFDREFKIAIVIALSCGIIGGGVCSALLSLRNPEFEFSLFRIISAFGIAMFAAIMVSTTLGLFLPFFFRKVDIDPAISSGPLVTTANDSISATIYMILTLLLVSL